LTKSFFSFGHGMCPSQRRSVGVALPGSRGIRNVRGDVVVPILGKGWLGSNVQHLSVAGRGVLIEMLMRLATGIGVTRASELQASLNLNAKELNVLLEELVRAELVNMQGSSLVVRPEITRELLMGKRGAGKDGAR
jgi:hypothetical protein